jgi:hypothetical protein
MKEETATVVADVVLLGVGLTAAWLIVRNPRLRRPALHLLRTFVTGTLPVYLTREVRTAWEVSGRRNTQGMMAE